MEEGPRSLGTWCPLGIAFLSLITHSGSRHSFCFSRTYICSALIDGHMLTNEEEVELVEGLHMEEHDEWVKKLYRCKCKKV